MHKISIGVISNIIFPFASWCGYILFRISHLLTTMIILFQLHGQTRQSVYRTHGFFFRIKTIKTTSERSIARTALITEYFSIFSYILYQIFAFRAINHGVFLAFCIREMGVNRISRSTNYRTGNDGLPKDGIDQTGFPTFGRQSSWLMTSGFSAPRSVGRGFQRWRQDIPCTNRTDDTGRVLPSQA